MEERYDKNIRKPSIFFKDRAFKAYFIIERVILFSRYRMHYRNDIYDNKSSIQWTSIKITACNSDASKLGKENRAS